MIGPERRARMGICALAPSGAQLVARALEEFGPVELWEALLQQGESTSWGRRALAVDLEAIERATAACGARFITPGDEEWPHALGELSQVVVAQQGGMPAGLWVKGASLASMARAVAVVGARACTGYGEHAAMTIAADLAAAGRAVISGLAFGIDAAAHRGALGVGGPTVAVLASGLDEPYPTANQRLAEAVTASGVLVSEVPPGYRPTKHAFLARNRLIAALAQAVLVVEAASRSGAKNTATWASALGRPVLAVPGPVTSALSATPHRLIREGEAILVTCSADVEAVLAPIGELEEPSGRGVDQPIDLLAPELREVREAVGKGEVLTPAQLSARTGQTIMEAMAHAAELAEAGWLEDEGGEFRLPGRR